MQRFTAGDLSGAVADLGVLVPLSAALVVVNGLEPGPVLLMAGVTALAAGLVFRVPFPVQPLKALTAIAVAQTVEPGVIRAAGIEIGACLAVLAGTGAAAHLARAFTKPVIRSLQLGVGALLVVSAVKLANDPPVVFTNAPPRSLGLALAAATLLVVAFAGWRRWYGTAALILFGGLLVAWVSATPALGSVVVELPDLSAPRGADFASALLLLVVPQLPLTFGNAVVGVSDLAHESFGPGARRVNPSRVALSAGVANVASGFAGGMPMCHGSSGLSAHVRLGAKTPWMNVLLGGTLLVLGLVFSHQVLALFGLLPVWALAGFLAYAGLRHALLVLDLRGRVLVMAVLAAGAGILFSNLAVTTGVALVAEHAGRLTRLRRRRAATVLNE
ncbi:MAG: hypothetical protein HYU28_04980 [Actinobacteria bacterium]|nr:hypothetical protein [Actinomycetota bacterium]